MLTLRRFAWVVGFSALAALAACSSSSPKTGGLRQACFANGTCNAGLVCLSQVCVAAPDGGAGMGGGGTSGSGGGTAGASAGTGGATAGAGGTAAVAGQSGNDAGAGQSGNDAAAGQSGSDAAAGTSGTDAGADGAAGADAGACPYKASYGNVVIASNIMSAQEHVYPANGSSQPVAVQNVQWSGVVRNAQIADTLDISFVSTVPPFGVTLTTMTGIDLSTQSDYQTCGACVVLALALDANGDFLANPQTFIAVSGTLNVTTLPPFPATATSRVTGSVSNVVFEHVSIDPTTSATTKLDNCQITLTSAAFDSPVTNQ